MHTITLFQQGLGQLRRWALLVLVLVLALPTWAGSGPVVVPGRGTTPSLAGALNPDGTLRAGVSGSFDPKGYRMGMAPDGKPVFRPAGVTGAGDEKWQDGFGISGANGIVYAVVSTGTDTYIAGRFTAVSEVAANRIAKWNGSRWSALGTGLNDEVRALAVSGGEVYAGGTFTTAGGVAANRMARWNGSRLLAFTFTIATTS